MKEIFKDVIGFKGHYQVSNLGRVKSVKFNKEKILKPGFDSNGYYIVNLCKNNKRYVKKIHQLVAMYFLDHNPNGMVIVVDHKNNIKTDNRLENLQIITNRQNTSKDKIGSSKYTGVCWSKDRNKWLSQIYINGKGKYLGLFENELDASIAYQNELKNIKK